MEIADNLEVFVLSYNRAVLLKEALESIVRQTRLPARVTVMDNASSDDTPGCIAHFAEKFHFISTIRQPVHVDVCKNMLTAIRAAKCEYFMMMHDDDLLDGNFIRCASSLLADEADVTMLCSTRREFKTGDKPAECAATGATYEIFPSKVDFAAADVARFLVKQGDSLCFPAVVYRRDCVSPMSLDAAKFGKILDKPFVYGSAGEGTIARICTPLYNYRIHEGQDTAASSNGPYPQEILAMLQAQRDLLAADGKYSAWYRSVSIRLMKSLFSWGGNDRRSWPAFVSEARRLGITNSMLARPWHLPLWRNWSNLVLGKMLDRATRNVRLGRMDFTGGAS